jgi:hypothetical protein
MRDLWRKETRNVSFELQDSYDEKEEDGKNQNQKSAFVNRWEVENISIDYDKEKEHWCDSTDHFSDWQLIETKKRKMKRTNISFTREMSDKIAVVISMSSLSNFVWDAFKLDS